MIAAALRALTIVTVDYLGVLAALGAAFSSWSQMHQHRTLATALTTQTYWHGRARP